MLTYSLTPFHNLHLVRKNNYPLNFPQTWWRWCHMNFLFISWCRYHTLPALATLTLLSEQTVINTNDNKDYSCLWKTQQRWTTLHSVSRLLTPLPPSLPSLPSPNDCQASLTISSSMINVARKTCKQVQFQRQTLTSEVGLVPAVLEGCFKAADVKIGFWTNSLFLA